MAAKLKSITGLIPWSLAGKSLFLAAVWLFLPYWVFLLGALYFYFVPLLRSFKFFLTYFIFLIIAAVVPANIFTAILIGVVSGLIIGVKNLIFIDRRPSYQIAVLILFFLIFFAFFWQYRFFQLPVLWGIAAIIIGGYFLLKNLFRYYTFPYNLFYESLFPLIAIFLIGQFLIILLVLPINFYIQLILSFAFLVFLLDLGLSYLGRHLTNKIVVFDSSLFFVIVLVSLILTNWGL